jgi:hypothetical protein
LRQLRENLALDAERSWEVADADSALLGEDVDAVRDRLCAQADVRVALVTPAYLMSGSRECSRVLSSSGPVVVFALSGFPDGPLNLASSHIHDIRRRTEPWNDLTRTNQRRAYVNELVDEIRRALRPASAARPSNAAASSRSRSRLVGQRVFRTSRTGCSPGASRPRSRRATDLPARAIPAGDRVWG